jgi:hypothetical protein
MDRGRTSDHMTHIQDDPDEVVARLQPLDPRHGVDYEIHDVTLRLARIVSGGTPRSIGAEDELAHGAKRAVHPNRRRYATIGALVGAGALAAALVLSAGSGAPKTSRPVRSALPSPVLRLGWKPFTSSVASAPTYDFTPGANLSQSSGTGTAYELSAPTDGSSVAQAIATALGLSGGVRSIGSGGYDAGAAPGPFATIVVNAGVLSWTYPNWGGNVNEYPSLATPQSIPVNPNAPLPTDVQATKGALQLLQSMGVNADQLGATHLSRASSAIDVEFRLVIGGLATDQWESVSYGPGGVVIYVSGVSVNATPSASYSTTSAAAAACLLAGDGYVSSFGYVPTGRSSCNTGATGSDVVNVTINSAVPELSTFVLADGKSWLLPTWGMSGPEAGSLVTAGSTYRGSVLSIPTQFVQPWRGRHK